MYEQSTNNNSQKAREAQVTGGTAGLETGEDSVRQSVRGGNDRLRSIHSHAKGSSLGRGGLDKDQPR
ncbi:hypothetical protein IMZ48_16995 [Candidatus Bathyarchaeota archaeon]|nr:hypothetical protein [Candidatus Bathyarchaeota archaeon]